MQPNLADILEQRREDLVKLQIQETRCGCGWAVNNVTLSVNYLREDAACVSSIMGHIPMSGKPDTMSFIFREHVEPVLTILP